MMITLKDIATKTGINTGSISHVLNNHPKAMELKAETREKIRRSAREMGYCRNEMAHSIATGKAKGIAFIAADMGQTAYTGKIQEGVFEEASELGYAVYFYHLTAGNEQEIIRKIREWRISGAVFHVAELGLTSIIRQELNRHNIPFGTVNLGNDRQAGIGVTTDDFQGAVDVVEHLAGLGHRRIAHLTMTGNIEFAANRCNGYLEGMKRFVAGTQPRIIESVTDDYREVCRKLLVEPENQRPTAVFCVMDTVAMELMREAVRRNVKIPEDLSIVGFGNLDMAEYAAIPLTTVAQPFKEMGCLTAAKIIEAIKNPVPAGNTVNLKLKTQLIIRKSTSKIGLQTTQKRKK
jgi:DNA-binding LacI/PurR family transcriptional regulator